jgi:hypothetical protein
LIQAGGETLRPEFQELINSIRNKEKCPDKQKKSIIEPIYDKGDKTVMK